MDHNQDIFNSIWKHPEECSPITLISRLMITRTAFCRRLHKHNSIIICFQEHHLVHHSFLTSIDEQRPKLRDLATSLRKLLSPSRQNKLGPLSPQNDRVEGSPSLQHVLYFARQIIAFKITISRMDVELDDTSASISLWKLNMLRCP